MNLRNSISNIAFMAADTGTGSGESEAAAIANGATLAAVTDEAKVTAIKKAMPSRKLYPTLADAVAALQKADAATRDPLPADAPEGTEPNPGFYGLPVGVVGMDLATGEIDSSVYEGQNAILGYVATKGDEAKKKESGIKSIVIYPIPTLESFIASPSGKEWLAKVMEKEVGLVVYRNLRDNATVDEFNAGIAKTPKGIDELVAEHTRGGAGLDTDTFDAVWPGLRLYLKKEQPLLSKALPAKAEVIKAIRSASYAASEFPALEKAGVFVKLAQTCVQAAKTNVDAESKAPAPLDTTALESWISNRANVNITKATKEEVDVDAAVAQFTTWAK